MLLFDAWKIALYILLFITAKCCYVRELMKNFFYDKPWEDVSDTKLKSITCEFCSKKSMVTEI